MGKENWVKDVKSYSENIVFGKKLRTFYNEKNEILNCESAQIDREELLKSLKRLHNKDLTKEPVKRRFPKNKKRLDEIKKAKASHKKKDS
tara:strand:+ start:527 stop:796 length:270 start_codon:yes stop_codon:yes gene_type:complete